MQITPEIIGYVAATFTTSSFLPQAIMTIRTRDTEGLSLSMYSIFTTGVLFWLIYGLLINNLAIIVANAITLLLAASILSFKIYNTLKKKKQ
ncbi:MAG: SemiSWEET transporter [Methylococcaceae bacterium]